MQKRSNRKNSNLRKNPNFGKKGIKQKNGKNGKIGSISNRLLLYQKSSAWTEI